MTCCIGTGSLRQEVRQEDDDDGQRADETDEEPEDTEDADVTRKGAAVGELVIYVCLLEPPSHKEDSQETS